MTLKLTRPKVEAIQDMPAPNDIKGLKGFLGMVNYLAKFLPFLSDITEPLKSSRIKMLSGVGSNSTSKRTALSRRP
jgi:hypothetical protein